MATAVVTRPAQALRNRRDAPRPSSISKRQTTLDGMMESTSKRRKLNEPYVRDSQYILEKHKGKQPSLVIHLYDATFRFEGQDVSWPYDSPMRCVINHLKTQTVPHEMMEELLSPGIQWYDGCLIVEVHNHRTKGGKEKGRQDSAANDGNQKFGMHNYTLHVTPSPMVPFPSKAVTDQSSEVENGDNAAGSMPAPERPKDEGPIIATVVLHPTQLSQHAELMVLMKTPADQVRSKKRGSDGATPSAQPPTPQMSVPPTPLVQTSRGSLTQSQKMCLEEGDLYTFQSDLLVATEPPLYLEPVDNPQDAEKVLELLQHPLHQAQPPSSKTRKRTTAEVAADDAQAAETERRLLIMDERIKPAGAGAGANENQSAAASLGFSRFKTIEMVRQKHEEAERLKKEEEARAALEKKQAEEQNALQQQKNEQLAQRQRQMHLLAQQQQQQQAQQQSTQNMAMQMRAEQMRQHQQARAQQALMNQAHGHPQQNGMLPNGQQNFPQGNQTSMPQSSPVVRQQTPMINSSPMMPQGGFPMAQTSSQGPGSPPRPTSGAMQNQMARQPSQQHAASRNNTPQIAQGTPAMGQAMPNRPTNQTPRMQPGSPAAGMQQQLGTPSSMSMQMPTPQMGNQTQLTPEQMQMLNAQRALSQGQQNGVPNSGSPMGQLTSEQISMFRNLSAQHGALHQQQMLALNQARANGNQVAVQNIQQDINRRQQQLKAAQAQIVRNGQQQQQQMMNAAQMGAHGGAGQAGSPGSMQQSTPQMGHAHPQQQSQQQPQQQQQGGNGQELGQMSPTQMANAHAKANHIAALRQNQQQFQQVQQQLQSLAQQYSGFNNIPQQVLNSLPPAAQQLMKQQLARQAAARQQQSMRAAAAQQQTQQQNGTEQVPGSQPNPQYMQQLRNNQAAMFAQMQNQQQQGGMNNLGMQSFTMGNGNQGGGGNGAVDNLTPQFVAMQNALTRQNSGQGQGGGMQ